MARRKKRKEMLHLLSDLNERQPGPEASIIMKEISDQRV
jgi:hypothetical protein